MSFFNECAKFGEEIISFAQQNKTNAVLVGIVCFISPVNIIIWLLILCALYKRGKTRKKL
jgi:hypothetical protein